MPGVVMRAIAVAALCLGLLAPVWGQASWPGHPYRLLWAGYSMQEGDWDVWEGVFDIIHFGAIGLEDEQVAAILDPAALRGMKVIVSANAVYDRERRAINAERVQAFVGRWGAHPGLFGFILEATYRVPLDDQMAIYSAFKAAAPDLPFWTEFSSTSAETWASSLNPEACDAIVSYNYPCEVTDLPGADCSRRIRYSTNAYRNVTEGQVPIIPLLQTFEGGTWRSPLPGEVITQYLTWENELGDSVVGMGCYRWRDNPNYKGICGDVLPAHVWEEVQTLSRHLAGRQ